MSQNASSSSPITLNTFPRMCPTIVPKNRRESIFAPHNHAVTLQFDFLREPLAEEGVFGPHFRTKFISELPIRALQSSPDLSARHVGFSAPLRLRRDGPLRLPLQKVGWHAGESHHNPREQIRLSDEDEQHSFRRGIFAGRSSGVLE